MRHLLIASLLLILLCGCQGVPRYSEDYRPPVQAYLPIIPNELDNRVERDSEVTRQDYNTFSGFAWAVFEAIQPWSAEHKIKWKK